MAPPVRYFSVDIETAGPIPGHHAMLSIGAVVVEPSEGTWTLGSSFYAELKPSHSAVVPEDGPKSPRVCYMRRGWYVGIM